MYFDDDDFPECDECGSSTESPLSPICNSCYWRFKETHLLEQALIEEQWALRHKFTSADERLLRSMGISWVDVEARAQIETTDWEKWKHTIYFQSLISVHGTPEERDKLNMMLEETRQETTREFERVRMALATRIAKHAPPTGWKW